MVDDHLAHCAVAGDDVHHALGQASLTADIGKKQCRKRGIFGRFQNDRITRCQGWGDLPCQHQQGEIPRDDLPADADGGMSGQFAVHQLRHARMVIEMPLRQRDVDVARFPNGFAVVQGFQHCEQAGVLLQQTGQRIKVFRTPVTTQFFPLRLGLACGGNGGLHVLRSGLGQCGQRFARGRVFRQEPVARIGEFAIDEMAEPVTLIDQPSQCLGCGFGGGAVVHGLENLFDSHMISPLGDGKRRNKRR